MVILKKWRQDNYRPVQYGQCWVFAGVMCTGKLPGWRTVVKRRHLGPLVLSKLQSNNFCKRNSAVKTTNAEESQNI